MKDIRSHHDTLTTSSCVCCGCTWHVTPLLAHTVRSSTVNSSLNTLCANCPPLYSLLNQHVLCQHASSPVHASCRQITPDSGQLLSDHSSGCFLLSSSCTAGVLMSSSSLAATMKSFSDSPSRACVHSSMVTLFQPWCSQAESPAAATKKKRRHETCQVEGHE